MTDGMVSGRWAALSDFVKRASSHNVVRSALLLYAVQISGYIFPLLALPYLSRVLSTHHFGVVTYAQNFAWYFVTLTEYGFNLTATRAIAVAKNDRAEVERIFGAVMAAKAILTAAGLAILLLVVSATPSLRGDLTIFLFAFLSVVGYFFFPLWLFMGMQQMGAVAVRDAAAKLLALIALVVLVRSDQDYELAALAQSAGLLVAGLVGLVTVRQQLGVRFHLPTWGDVRGQLVQAWPAFISIAFLSFTFVTNIFVAGLIVPSTEVAYFGAIWRIIAVMRSLNGPISMAVFPHVSQKAAVSEREAIQFVRQYRWMLITPFAVLGVVMTLSAPWAVGWVLGPQYREAVPVLQVMAMIPALFAAQQIFSTYHMLACGYDREWMRIVWRIVLVNVLSLGATLIFFRGSMALALTLLVADAVGAGLYFRFFRSRAKELAA